MSYRVLIPRPVQKQLDSLPSVALTKILQRLQELEENPRPIGCVKLKGYVQEYRIRVGDYRVRYEINDEQQIVVLLLVKHRKDVYRE
jgi:mRNA interferase RelE/StbE